MKIGFVGSGNMATALIKGWQPSHEISIYSPHNGEDKSAELSVSYKNLNEISKWSDYLVLAMPIENLDEVSREIEFSNNLISVLGGISLETLRKKFPSAQTVTRTLPNINVQIKQGYTALAFEKNQLLQVVNLFDEVGTTDVIKESEFSIVSAAAGSGPAFVDNVILKYIDAVEKMGLDRKTAERITLKTFSGTINNLAEGQIANAAKSVMTPGGSTEAGWETLESSDIEGIFIKTLQMTINKNNTAE